MKYGKWLVILCITFVLSVRLSAQTNVLNDVVKAFETIETSRPLLEHFKSNLKTPGGGHLQGVQLYLENKKEHFIITASSADFAYYITSPVDGEGSITKISDEPFRHAGGCQLTNGFFFTGVEDNTSKDMANVVMLSPGNIISENIIIRKGSYKRSTAGAVGAIWLKNEYVVAVGDWDSRNIDFYRSSDKGFDSIVTFSAPGTGKWGSYQSINLLADTAGQLYMIGFCREGNVNRADLFSIIDYQLTLVGSRSFACTKKCSFRYGAGIHITDKNELLIFATQRKLKKRNSVNRFCNR